MNLAVNARDAMPAAAGSTIETGNVDARRRARRGATPDAAPAAYVVLSRSRDTGIGMDARRPARASSSRSSPPRAGQGHRPRPGDGLRHRQAARRHIARDSEPGRGTTFRVLPAALARPASRAAERAPTSAAPRGGSETILLVEDESRSRRLARLTLERAGYRVLEAATARGARACGPSIARAIDLLLTDVVMPEG